MLNKLLSRIPQNDPDVKIGPLSLWVSGYNDENQKGQGDLSYLNTPTLFANETIVVFSEKSDTPLFCFKEFLKELRKMYDNIGDRYAAEFSSHESEFSLKLTNDLGHIKIEIKYGAWTQESRFELEDTIDQSYLPSIIGSLDKIIERFL